MKPRAFLFPLLKSAMLSVLLKFLRRYIRISTMFAAGRMSPRIIGPGETGKKITASAIRSPSDMNVILTAFFEL